MSKLSRDDILKLARLARLDVTEAEVEEYSRELSDILQYVEQLGEADIADLKPTNQITGLTNVTRADEVRDYGYDVKELLSNVPNVQDNQIKAKRMVG